MLFKSTFEIQVFLKLFTTTRKSHSELVSESQYICEVPDEILKQVQDDFNLRSTPYEILKQVQDDFSLLICI